MIPWVHQRCISWAEWASRSSGSGLGYPRQAIYTNLTGGIRGRLFMGEWNAQAARIDDVVRALPPALRQLTHQEYFKPGTDQQKARALGLSRATYFRHLHQAHETIARRIDK